MKISPLNLLSTPMAVLTRPDEHKTNVRKYVYGPIDLGMPIHFLIIDDRFRRRCLLAAREVIAPHHGVMNLHDAQKPQYHSSLSSFPNVRINETEAMPGSSQQSTMALCTLEDPPWLGQLLEKYHASNWVGDQ